MSSSCMVTIRAQRFPCHVMAWFPLMCVKAVSYCSLEHLCSCTIPGIAHFHASFLTKTSQTPSGDILGLCSVFGPMFKAGIQLSNPRLHSLQSAQLNSCLHPEPGMQLGCPPACCAHHATATQQSATSRTSAPTIGLVFQELPDKLCSQYRHYSSFK